MNKLSTYFSLCIIHLDDTTVSMPLACRISTLHYCSVCNQLDNETPVQTTRVFKKNARPSNYYNVNQRLATKRSSYRSNIKRVTETLTAKILYFCDCTTLTTNQTEPFAELYKLLFYIFMKTSFPFFYLVICNLFLYHCTTNDG